MELKDVILSTLAEMEENASSQQASSRPAPALSQPKQPERIEMPETDEVPSDEKLFLQNVRERLLVLFEGFQSPNNTQIEAKVDLTLNFLEYLLATVDTRIDVLSKKER